MKKSVLVDKFGKPLANSQFYRALNSSRERRYISTVASDSSQTLSGGSRKQLMGLARFLFANSGLCLNAISDLSRYSVSSGLRPQSQIEQERAKEYETYFNQWQKVADVSGKFTFQQMQYLMSLRCDIDGDILLYFTSTNTGYPACQLIEGHRIESDWNDNDYNDGVRLDKWGKPVAYKVKIGDTYKKIAAKDCILFMNPDRADQVRGVSALAPAINNVANMEDLIHFETLGVKVSSGITAVITNMSGEIDSGNSFIQSGDTAAEQNGGLGIDTFQSGMIPRLKDGESIESFASNKPNAVWPHFINHLVRNIASGLSLPPEFVWDASSLNGVSTRLIIKKAERTFRQRQQLLINKVLNRVWAWVIAKGIKRGDLASDPNWWKVKFIPDKSIGVDMKYEHQQIRDDHKMGLLTMEQIAAENGSEWREIRQQIQIESTDLLQRAKAMSEKEGVSLELCLNLLSSRSPNPNLSPDLED